MGTGSWWRFNRKTCGSVSRPVGIGSVAVWTCEKFAWFFFGLEHIGKYHFFLTNGLVVLGVSSWWKLTAATAGTSRDWFQSPWRWGLEPIRYKMGLPFRELTYPIKNHFWVDDFPNFSFGGICIRSLEGIIIAPLYFLDEKTWVSLFFFCGILMGGSHDSICN